MAFAVKLLSREASIDECTQLEEAQLKELKKLLAPLEEATETGLIIHDELCFGCGNCVVACPVNVANDPNVAIGGAPTSDKVILHVIDGVVRAFNVESCRRFGEERILCDVCIKVCPLEAIEFV
jgi:4Fe-4S ferredoxin